MTCLYILTDGYHVTVSSLEVSTSGRSNTVAIEIDLSLEKSNSALVCCKASISYGVKIKILRKTQPIYTQPFFCCMHKALIKNESEQGKFDEFISPDEGLFERNM